MGGKSINRYHSFCSSLINLKEAQSQDPSNIFVLSGTVQMYQLSFDLAWKVMKDIIVQYHGVTDFAAGSPRETLRAAKAVGLIEDDIWMQMLRARNNLAHDYDGELAKRYFIVINSTYFHQLTELRQRVYPYYEENC